MFTSRTTNKDRQKFINFFCRLNKTKKDFIIRSYLSYAEEKHNEVLGLNKFLKYDLIAGAIFDKWQADGIREIMVDSAFNELLLLYSPWTYNEGPSEYWQQLKRDEGYINL